ncbi:hypothetical protein NEOC65_001347 [Neochlamydia sp. AcF65]|nr:hypothetical protein [Neochlamydia sp. AcF65]MBS4170131.1 hypothetical protein [Neochlamydia sp. AcF95]
MALSFLYQVLFLWIESLKIDLAYILSLYIGAFREKHGLLYRLFVTIGEKL